MQDQEILKIINNLKGRKNYEQKKAIKLGFSSLYAYLEDKTLKQKKESLKKTNTDVAKKKVQQIVVVAKSIFSFFIFF